jgi:hypothetical protein
MFPVLAAGTLAAESPGTMLKMSVPIAAVLLIAGTNGTAAAEEPPAYAGVTVPRAPEAAPPHERRLTLETTFGLGTPVGLAGLGVDFALNDQFAVSGGFGVNTDGPQYALMARHRWKLDKWSASVGAGASLGRHVWQELVWDNPAQKRWDVAVWGNVELSAERRFDEYQVRWFAGAGAILNRSDGKCVGDTVDHCERYHEHDGFAGPYVGVALGWGWDI